MAIRRVVLSFVWLVTASIGAPANADEPPSARAIIDKAIAFAGGREALARYKKPFVRQSEGTVIDGGGSRAIKVKLTTWFPDKTRTDQTGERGTFLLVFNGDQGWHKSTMTVKPPPGIRTLGPPNTGTQEMKEVGVKMTRDRMYQQWLTTLLPLNEPAFRFSAPKEVTIDNRPALGIIVSHDDRPDVELYFDKETFALVKLARKINDRSYEEFYHNYSELDGLKFPTVVQQFANGKKLVELQTTDLKFLDAVEDGTFAQP